MPDSNSTPPYHFVAYIDEAGDPGIKTVRPLDPDGASEWLCVGAVLIRAEREKEIMNWVSDIRKEIRARQRPDLHFRDLTEIRKQKVCRHIATLPLRGFVMASNKKNMRGYRNPRAENHHPRQWFYNFCLRLIIERISDYCERRSIKEHGEPKYVKIIFSRRGGTHYSHTIAYQELLKIQSESGTLVLKKHDIKWRVIHNRLFEVIPHNQNAGLQLADVVASSFYQAVDVLGSTAWNTHHARALKKIMTTHRNFHANYGVALQPTPPWKAKLTPEQKEIFEFYGYNFR